MAELLVIGYEDPSKAEAAREALLKMSKEYLVELVDAVVAKVDEKGKVKLDQLVHPWLIGMANGTFWGFLIGLIFFMPLLGVLSGAVAGALAGAMTDFGIDDDFMKEVSQMLQPGQAALFILAKQNVPDKVIDELAKFGGRLLRTNLDTSQEAKLREAFSKAQSSLTDQNQEATG